MLAIKNHTLEQAQELLTYLNDAVGGEYSTSSDIFKRYKYWYIPVVPEYDSFIPNEAIERVENIDDKIFKLVNNPSVNPVFNIGVDVIAETIEIYGNNMNEESVNAEINSYISNYSNFKTDVFNSLHIGGSDIFPLNANSTPSQSVIDACNTFVTNNKAEVIYWDGQKNIITPNNRLRIETDQDYNIIDVSNTFKNTVSVNTDNNVFFTSKETFIRFAQMMQGEKYTESGLKCAVIYDNALSISRVFIKPESSEEIELGGLNLAYAPIDFFLKAISLDQLGAPNMDIWNDFIENNPDTTKKRFLEFPVIDTSALE